MFTGIIEEVGEVVSIRQENRSAKLAFRGKLVTKDSRIGDSIAVNGLCLTATEIKGDIFTADVTAESMKRSALGMLSSGSRVNLERAMPAQGRFGGHIVSGHIDGTGVIESLLPEENAVWLTVQAKPSILRYVIEKGSIAIDGISLTVAYVNDSHFKVSVIPHTWRETTLVFKKAGDLVNLENDVIAKYVEKLMQGSCDESGGKKNTSRIDEKFLAENGFL